MRFRVNIIQNSRSETALHSARLDWQLNAAPWQRWKGLHWLNLTTLIAVTFMAVVIAKDWTITALIPHGVQFAKYIHYGGIFVVVPMLLLRPNSRLDDATLVMIAAFSFGSFLATYPEEAVFRWLGVAATIASVGPLIRSPRAQWFRVMAWKVAGLGFILTAVGSLLWVVLPLPRAGGLGIFSGMSLHSKTMALNATAAICILAAWSTRRNARWVVPLIVISVGMVVLSGSRASVMTSVVCLTLIFLIRGVKYVHWVVILAVCAIAVLYFGPVDEFFKSRTGQYYVEKGAQNTREHLWKMRLSEIRNFPIAGVGVGMAEVILRGEPRQETLTGYAFIDAEGKVTIEPGSSWLAVFSMTGFIGGIAFTLVFARAAWRLAASRRQVDPRKWAEIVAVGVCFSMHMIEGGFVLSFGNAHCLLFWLWLGHASDLPRVKHTQWDRSGLRPARY